jgi:DNA-directed RNA polymerase subunit L
MIWLPGVLADLSAVTYNIKEEDHTLGNALRWMTVKTSELELRSDCFHPYSPDVKFCGYRSVLVSLPSNGQDARSVSA